MDNRIEALEKRISELEALVDETTDILGGVVKIIEQHAPIVNSVAVFIAKYGKNKSGDL